MRIIPSLRSLLFAFILLAISGASFAQIGVSVRFGPPAIPVYAQPPVPGEGYIWTPGYWAWDGNDYYWVPGTWVLAPEVGFLWTPGYWGWGGSAFFFHEGYWGPHVGFYGGINYGFGYFGEGYGGGRWDHGHFFYNTYVTHVDVVNIHNVYNTTIVNNNVTHVSYNGGAGGIARRPTPQEDAAGKERHTPPVAAQTEHAKVARANPDLRAAVNHGKPAIAATSKAGDFSEHSVVAAKEPAGVAKPEAVAKTAEPRATVHPNELPPIARP